MNALTIREPYVENRELIRRFVTNGYGKINETASVLDTPTPPLTTRSGVSRGGLHAFYSTVHIDGIDSAAMKNGRALEGHCRVIVGIGEAATRNQRRPGGYEISCRCGWTGGWFALAGEAKSAYRAHIDYQIDSCLRKCKSCGEEKPLREMRSDYRHMCKRCFSIKGNKWQRSNPEASARHKRNHHLLKKFGITVSEAESLLEAQGGVCAICCEPISDKRGFEPHVDHDHNTGMVRGILCFKCNAGLGQFADDIQRMRSAIDYLQRSSEK